MSVNTYRPYQENGQIIDVAVVGNGGKTTFMNSFLGTKDSDLEGEGSKVLEYPSAKNGEIFTQRIVVRMSSNEDRLVENGKIGFVVCKVTESVKETNIASFAQLLRNKKIQDIYILATHCDKETDRIVTQEQLNTLVASLNLKGVIEVNAKDKKDVRKAVQEIAAPFFVQPEMPLSKRLKSLREAKATPVQTPEPAKEEVKKPNVVLIKQSTFWSWFLNIFSCFGIFYTVIARPAKDISPPDVKDF